MGKLKLGKVEVEQKTLLVWIKAPELVEKKKKTEAGNDSPQYLMYSHVFNRNLTRKLVNIISFFARIEYFAATFFSEKRTCFLQALFFFLAAPVACGSSRARDQT